MRLQQVHNRVRDRLERLVTLVKTATAMDQTDINRLLESVFCPVLQVALELPGLRNLNEAERRNYPGIDLGDASRGVGIQVTSNADAKKIRKTLGTCIRNGVHETYPKVLFYVLTEKQGSYKADFSDDSKGLIDFDPVRDVLDYTDLAERLAAMELPQLEKVDRILDQSLGLGTETPEDVDVGSTETTYLNLIRIDIADSLFVADLIPDASGGTWQRSQRDTAKRYLNDQGVRFATDWSVHANQVITFHELGSRSVALSEIIDPGTVTELDPEEYYGVSDDLEHAFKDLLRRCLQQKLYHRGVHWQHKERLFFFGPDANDSPTREEHWFGRKTASRTVYEHVLRRDDPERTYHHKHFAFATSFHRIDELWYLALKPEWFFSRDGYKPWFYAPDSVDWLKKHERNQHVFNHVQFIAHFLQTDPNPDLFKDFAPYQFLSFGSLVSLDGSPRVPDEEWRAGEASDVQKQLVDPSSTLELALDFT